MFWLVIEDQNMDMFLLKASKTVVALMTIYH